MRISFLFSGSLRMRTDSQMRERTEEAIKLSWRHTTRVYVNNWTLKLRYYFQQFGNIQQKKVTNYYRCSKFFHTLICSFKHSFKAHFLTHTPVVGCPPSNDTEPTWPVSELFLQTGAKNTSFFYWLSVYYIIMTGLTL